MPPPPEYCRFWAERANLAVANRPMRAHPMAPIDAQFYWMSQAIPNDQFLLYAFAGVPEDLDVAVAEVLARSRVSTDLSVRLADAGRWRYPRWVPTPEPAEVLRHPERTWADCLDAIVRLTEDQLDLQTAAWRLHVFAPVRQLPGYDGAGTVVVMQIAHALADGGRASALAGWLFGRAAPVAPLVPTHPGWAALPWRAAVAARAHHVMVADTRAGTVPPPATSRPPLATNTRPAGTRAVRTLVRRRAQLRGPTVTVAVLSAVSEALSEYLDESCDELGAEVPLAKTGARLANNHFGNITVGLYPGLPSHDRLDRIHAELAAARRRAAHPAVAAGDRAVAAMPAAVLAWGVGKFDPDIRPAQVAGNTVVSSVNRGAGDLHFGAAPVLLTAGFPALSPAMGLTHGVHGIADTVVISVHAAESAIADIGSYVQLLDTAL